MNSATFYLAAIAVVFICGCSMGAAANEQFESLRNQWEDRAANKHAEVTGIEVLPDSTLNRAEPNVIVARTSKRPKLTATLVEWISDQSEGIVEEMEAIAKHNSETSKFSVVSYLRYMSLFDHLKVIDKKSVPEFKWVSRKVKTFARIYSSVMQIVFDYLHDVDAMLRSIEDNEPKSKQVDPSGQWIERYETIRFIALHAPERSELAKAAIGMLTYSPTNTADKARHTRYLLKTRAFSK